MLKIIKNSTLTNNKKEIGVTKNGKTFLAPRVQSPSLQSSRFHASRSPEYKRTIVPSRRVQSPSVQSFRVQGPIHPESKCSEARVYDSKVQESRVQASRPYAQSPAFPVYLFKHYHSNLNAIYSNRFCNNVL